MLPATYRLRRLVAGQADRGDFDRVGFAGRERAPGGVIPGLARAVGGAALDESTFAAADGHEHTDDIDHAARPDLDAVANLSAIILEPDFADPRSSHEIAHRQRSRRDLVLPFSGGSLEIAE